ncbi:MAG TPA: hypothetical protein VED17_02590 [Nitrososphaerales archaeon]|nr:hypothetical protein [Nitrososphaerales archaeon]
MNGYGINPVNTAKAKATAITVIITREVVSISHLLVVGDSDSFKPALSAKTPNLNMRCSGNWMENPEPRFATHSSCS